MKKTIALILAFTMMLGCALCFSGCGETESSTDAVIKLGGIGPLTGPYANYGLSVRNGCAIAVDEINAAGGVNGYKLELTFLDSEGDGDKAVAAYGKLVDGGMNISLGGVLSGETASVVAANDENGYFLLTPSASSKAAIEGSDCAFRICFNDPSQGTASAHYIHDHNLAKKVAILYQSDIDYSAGIVKTFKAAAEELGIEVVKEVYFQTGAVDFSSQLDAIVASGADFVFLPIYAAEGALILTQAQDYAELKDVTFFGCDGLDGVVGQLDEHPEYAEGVMLLTPFSADDTDEKVVNFVAKYKEAHNETPDQFAANAYDAVYVIAEALKAANVSAENPLSQEDLNKALVSVMTTIEVKGITGTMTWGADGETVKDAKAMYIKDGANVLYVD